MKLTPEDLKRARLILRTVQILLIAALLIAIWLSSHTALWQKLLATVLAGLLLAKHPPKKV